MNSANIKSSFFRRVYGSYTTGQATRILSLYPAPPPVLRLLDPFCGLGSLLPTLVARGHSVDAIDVNPVAVAFVDLRRPEYLRVAQQAVAVLAVVLKHLPSTISSSSARFEQGWLTDDVADWLGRYSQLVKRHTPAGGLRDDHEAVVRALTRLPLLAARDLTTYSSSDNASWLKAGGLQRTIEVRESLSVAAHAWIAYLKDAYPQDRIGTLTVSVGDARSLTAESEYDGVVFSPPYANRLDYVRMLAPEIAVLEALVGDVTRVSPGQLLGTTVVRNFAPDPIALRKLPVSARGALNEIRHAKAKASSSYYYPFFANYAIGLDSSIRCVARALRPGGRGLIFVRDTPRKDVLFPTGNIIASILRSSGCTVQASSRVVTHHIGMRRKRTHVSLQGLAQREWSIAFQRRA
jgi:hypothetical protein